MNTEHCILQDGGEVYIDCKKTSKMPIKFKALIDQHYRL